MMTASKLCTLISNLRWSDAKFSECAIESISSPIEKSILTSGIKSKEEIKRFWLRVNDPNVFALYLNFNYENSKLKSIDVTAYLGSERPSNFIHLKSITKGKDQVLKTLYEKITSEKLKEKKRLSAQKNKLAKQSLKLIEAFSAQV